MFASSTSNPSPRRSSALPWRIRKAGRCPPSAAAAIIVQMQDGEQRYSNAYSLLSSPFELDRYQIAVRRESPSKGGSDFMHDRLAIGDTLTISTPITCSRWRRRRSITC